jgi:hypothetical protein
VPPGGPPHQAGPSAQSFLNIAQKQLGEPYTWGGSSPSAGFDCSGLVQYALMKAGLRDVPRTSEQQYAWVQHISAAQLQPGDLIFEQWPGDGPAPGHVAIFTGKGKIEEAPQPGQPVHEVPWSPGEVTAEGGRVVGYGRVPGLSGLGKAVGAAGGGIGGLLSIPGEITGAFATAGKALDWLVQPSSWIRILSGWFGVTAVLSGLVVLAFA